MFREYNELRQKLDESYWRFTRTAKGHPMPPEDVPLWTRRRELAEKLGLIQPRVIKHLELTGVSLNKDGTVGIRGFVSE